MKDVHPGMSNMSSTPASGFIRIGAPVKSYMARLLEMRGCAGNAA
jgi:hypothetical protein